MMRFIGSQIREKLEETDLVLHKRLNDSEIVLADGDKLELWFANDGHSGYTIEIDGIGYEFVRDYNNRQ